MDFHLTDQQERLRQRCLTLAADFATRSAEHDRDASHPTENYDRLRAEGFLALTIDTSYGGQGFDFLSHTIAYEALGQGCPATAFLKEAVRAAAWGVPGIHYAEVRLTYEPKWSPVMMSEAARQSLGSR